MAQVDKSRERQFNDGGGLVAGYSKNIDVASTDAYVTALDIDSRAIRESVFTIFNTHASNSIDYKIWANADIYPAVDLTGTDDTDFDNGWVIIKAETSLAGSATPVIETLSNPYSRVVVQIKATVGASQGTVRIFHRGEN